MSSEIKQDRRRFLSAAASIATAQLGMTAVASAQAERNLPAFSPGTNTTFSSLKQVNAGVLNVGYAEAGPVDGPPVLLLHGFPYDIHSFVDVAPLLGAAGYRAIVPHLRGHGTTRFLSNATVRNGQQAAVALDTIALMDARKPCRPSSTPSSKSPAMRGRNRVRDAPVG
jgi:predicted alpha/beta-fold hydrolase